MFIVPKFSFITMGQKTRKKLKEGFNIFETISQSNVKEIGEIWKEPEKMNK
jgi:hypothetical protein